MGKNPAFEESKNYTQDQGRNEEIEPPESPINRAIDQASIAVFPSGQAYELGEERTINR